MEMPGSNEIPKNLLYCLPVKEGTQSNRKKRNSFFAVAALTLAGLTSNGIEATAEVKDSSPDLEAEKAATPADGDAQSTPAATVHNFKIPAGVLSEVIEALKKETGLSFALTNDSIGTVLSPGVTGVLTTQEALTQLLANTGVSARFETEERIVLSLTGNASSVDVSAGVLSSPKYTAPLLDLPQTINIISAETIQNTASTSLVEALRTVPGITFGAGEGGNPIGDRPFIRGMDSQSSTYIDGIRDLAAQSRETFDIESIEVQEGPGGAYGGRGTGGGSINMNSKLARRSNFIAGSFMPGTNNYKRGTVDANAKLGEWTSARLTGMWHDADVAGRGPVHTGRWGFAPSIAFGLGHPTRLYLDYYHLITNNIPDSGVPYNNPSKTPTTDPGPQLYTAGDGQPIKLPYRNIFWGLTDRDKDREYAKIATGRVERDVFHEHALLRNSFRYEHVSQDYLWTQPDDSQGNIYFGLLFRRVNSKLNSVFTTDNQTDLSGQLQTGKIKHSYATGMEFSSERSNVDTVTNNSTSGWTGAEDCKFGPGAASGYNCTYLFSPDYHDNWAATGVITKAHNPAHYKAGTQSAYVFDTIQFSKHFLSTLGARYDHYDTVYHSAKATGTGVITSYPVVNNLGSYLGSVIYKPDHVTNIYATISTSSIPTGNSLAQGSDTSSLSTAGNNNLQPQFIREEEFGAKRELNGGRSLVRVAFYRLDIQNVRITQSDGTVAAAGNNRTLGAEAGVSGMLTNKWQFTGGYSYIDAILVSAGGSGTAYGATDGLSMPNTARHNFSITSNYHLTRKLNLGGGIYGQTMVWGNHAQNKWVPGYTREDLFGNYEINKHFNLQANVLNLSNKLYYQQAYATHYAIPAPARNAVFGINVNF